MLLLLPVLYVLSFGPAYAIAVRFPATPMEVGDPNKADFSVSNHREPIQIGGQSREKFRDPHPGIAVWMESNGRHSDGASGLGSNVSCWL